MGISLAAGAIIAAIIGGIVSTISQISANNANKEMVDSTNQANKDIASMTNAANSAEAEKNRQFQLMMSNTAHQREVADLQAAGLNPWLSVSGAGSATTSGATANMHSASMQAGHVNSLGDMGLSQVASIMQSMAFMQALNQRADTLATAKTNSAQIYANAKAGSGINNVVDAVNKTNLNSAKKQRWTKSDEAEVKRLLREIKA